MVSAITQIFIICGQWSVVKQGNKLKDHMLNMLRRFNLLVNLAIEMGLMFVCILFDKIGGGAIIA